MTKPSIKPLLKTLGAWLLCSLIIGCDGGIFGTGDGSNDSFILEGTGSDPTVDGPGIPATDSEAPAAEPGDAPDNEPGDSPDNVQVDESVDAPVDGPTPPSVTPSETPVDAPDEAPVTTVDSANSITDFDANTDVTVASGPSASFVNTFVVAVDNTTQVQLLNLTSEAVSVFTNPDTDATAIAVTSQSNFVAEGVVSEDTTTLLIDAVNDAGVRTTLTTINPTELATGSRTTIILRGLEPAVETIILPAATATLASDQVALRIVSAALIGDPLTPSNFTLESVTTTETTQTQDAITFESVTFASPVTNYQLVNTGTFILNDDAARYTELAIDLNLPGAVVTVVLDPSLPNQHIVLIDN